jgi:DNA-binding GntR family transcriptional regulator
MKTDTVYKQAFNDMLDLLGGLGVGDPLPSENDLGAQLGVSRTTVRKVMVQLAGRQLITPAGRERRLRAKIPPGTHFPAVETVSASAQVEKRFMEWMLRGDAQPGSQINELELARQFAVGTTGIREFLNRFRRFGLIEKRPNAGWRFKGFTEDFAVELFEIREMFELRSAARFATLPAGHPVWENLSQLEAEHHQLLAEIDTRFHDFSDLDNRFHRFVNGVAPNRFIDDFYEIITFIFHYHYQWNKRDERQRNEVAVREHLDYVDALKRRDPSAIETACRTHLASAKATLLRATVGGEGRG